MRDTSETDCEGNDSSISLSSANSPIASPLRTAVHYAANIESSIKWISFGMSSKDAELDAAHVAIYATRQYTVYVVWKCMIGEFIL